jgi:hypothetical protein
MHELLQDNCSLLCDFPLLGILRLLLDQILVELLVFHIGKVLCIILVSGSAESNDGLTAFVNYINSNNHRLAKVTGEH